MKQARLPGRGARQALASTLTSEIEMNNAQYRLPLKGILAALAAAGLCCAGQALAGTAYRNHDDPAGTKDQKLHAAIYELDTDLWGLHGETGQWHLKIDTGNEASKPMAGSSWTWSGVTATKGAGVVGFPSIQVGVTNDRNDPAASGLPYVLGDNSTPLNVRWHFTATGDDGTGAISGRYNHVVDVFFSSRPRFDTSRLGLEIMIIPDSSSDSQQGGWGFREAQPFVIDNETWDVWNAIQDVSGNGAVIRRWPVIQFRARDKKTAFDNNLNRFFAEAMKRHPAWFPSGTYVLNVDTGTEVKDGAGKLLNNAYRVSVNGR